MPSEMTGWKWTLWSELFQLPGGWCSEAWPTLPEQATIQCLGLFPPGPSLSRHAIDSLFEHRRDPPMDKFSCFDVVAPDSWGRLLGSISEAVVCILGEHAG